MSSGGPFYFDRGLSKADNPLISSVKLNRSQTPEEEVRLMDRKQLRFANLDVDLFLKEVKTRVGTAIPINPKEHIDNSCYKLVKVEHRKFAAYMMKHKL